MVGCEGCAWPESQRGEACGQYWIPNYSNKNNKGSASDNMLVQHFKLIVIGFNFSETLLDREGLPPIFCMARNYFEVR